MRRTSIRSLLAAALALWSWACAAPPEKEMAQAREALSVARAAGAEQYAAQEYQDAAAAMQRSESFVSERDHRQALSAALDARERAESAREAAANAKAEARARAHAALEEVETATSEARGFVDQATERPPRSRPERLHVSEVRRAIVVANVALQKAREAVSGEDYTVALKELEGVNGRLREVLAAKPPAPSPAKAGRRR